MSTMKDKGAKSNAKYKNQNSLFIADPYCIAIVGVRAHYRNEESAKSSFKLLGLWGYSALYSRLWGAYGGGFRMIEQFNDIEMRNSGLIYNSTFN